MQRFCSARWSESATERNREADAASLGQALRPGLSFSDISISLKLLALAAIDFYKRYVSPFKGFSCAYRVHTGSCSCSTLGARAIRRYGLLRGLSVLHERTFLCGVAHRRYGCARLRRTSIRQRGDCDLGCDGIDLDLCSGKGGGRLCDFLSWCDCGSCDWRERKTSGPDRSKRRRKNESEIHLPNQYATRGSRRNGESL